MTAIHRILFMMAARRDLTVLQRRLPLSMKGSHLSVTAGSDSFSDSCATTITLNMPGKPPLIGDLRYVNPGTVAMLEALLSRAMLRHLAHQGPPLLIMAVPRLQRTLIADLAQAAPMLAQTLAPLLLRLPFHWMVLSSSGGSILSLPSWKIVSSQNDPDPLREPSYTAPLPLPFSDATEVILKHLLYTYVSFTKSKQLERWWGSPLGSCDSIDRLAVMTQTSQSSVYRLMRSLWSRGIAAPQRTTLVQPADLLQSWLVDAHQQVHETSIAFEPMYPPAGGNTPARTRAWLTSQASRWRSLAAISGWHALELLGMSGVGHQRPLTLVTRSDADLRLLAHALKMQPCAPAHAWCWGEVAHRPRSAFAGVTTVKQLAVVDLWQAACDVARDAHGMKQAQRVAATLGVTLTETRE